MACDFRSFEVKYIVHFENVPESMGSRTNSSPVRNYPNNWETPMFSSVIDTIFHHYFGFPSIFSQVFASEIVALYKITLRVLNYNVLTPWCEENGGKCTDLRRSCSCHCTALDDLYFTWMCLAWDNNYYPLQNDRAHLKSQADCTRLWALRT